MHAFRIGRWIGSTSDAAEHDAALGNQFHLSSGDSGSHRGGGLPEGVEVAQRLLRCFLSQETRLDILLEKRDGRVLLRFVSEARPPEPLLGVTLLGEDEGVRARLLFQDKGTRLQPGLIDLERVSQFYPRTLLEDVVGWSEGSGILLRLETPDEQKARLQEALCRKASDAACFLGSATASSSTSSTHSGSAIFYTRSSTSQSQSQVSGAATTLDSLDRSISQHLLPTLGSRAQALRITEAFAIGNVRDVLRTFSWFTPRAVPPSFCRAPGRSKTDTTLSLVCRNRAPEGG
jgi:hypothetical protein